MTRQVVTRRQATEDLIGIAAHIAEDNLSAAERLLDAFEQTTKFLRVVPTIGAVCQVKSHRAKGLRIVAVRGFRSILLLYRFDDEFVDVLRVVHGARDLGPIVDDVP
jgi:toxin ParE1/3/4